MTHSENNSHSNTPYELTPPRGKCEYKIISLIITPFTHTVLKDQIKEGLWPLLKILKFFQGRLEQELVGRLKHRLNI